MFYTLYKPASRQTWVLQESLGVFTSISQGLFVSCRLLGAQQCTGTCTCGLCPCLHPSSLHKRHFLQVFCKHDLAALTGTQQLGGDQPLSHSSSWSLSTRKLLSHCSICLRHCPADVLLPRLNQIDRRLTRCAETACSSLGGGTNPEQL